MRNCPINITMLSTAINENYNDTLLAIGQALGAAAGRTRSRDRNNLVVWRPKNNVQIFTNILLQSRTLHWNYGNMHRKTLMHSGSSLCIDQGRWTSLERAGRETYQKKTERIWRTHSVRISELEAQVQWLSTPVVRSSDSEVNVCDGRLHRRMDTVVGSRQ